MSDLHVIIHFPWYGLYGQKYGLCLHRSKAVKRDSFNDTHLYLPSCLRSIPRNSSANSINACSSSLRSFVVSCFETERMILYRNMGEKLEVLIQISVRILSFSLHLLSFYGYGTELTTLKQHVSRSIGVFASWVRILR